MFALMNPSNVATRSSTRGTSCGSTVVTRTSGGVVSVCAGLREQLTPKKALTTIAGRQAATAQPPASLPTRNGRPGDTSLAFTTPLRQHFIATVLLIDSGIS